MQRFQGGTMAYRKYFRSRVQVLEECQEGFGNLRGGWEDLRGSWGPETSRDRASEQAGMDFEVGLFCLFCLR